MNLRNLVEEINYIDLINLDEMVDEVEGISYNSKNTKPNDLFICLSGEHVDGHEYAEEAMANGAIACVVERRLSSDIPQILVESTTESMARLANALYDRPTNKINVIGVTGTNGKTQYYDTLVYITL